MDKQGVNILYNLKNNHITVENINGYFSNNAGLSGKETGQAPLYGLDPLLYYGLIRDWGTSTSVPWICSMPPLILQLSRWRLM